MAPLEDDENNTTVTAAAGTFAAFSGTLGYVVDKQRSEPLFLPGPGPFLMTMICSPLEGKTL